MMKSKEETGKGKGCIPLLLKLEEGNNNFHTKMGKEYSNLKKRREEDKKVRKWNVDMMLSAHQTYTTSASQMKSTISTDNQLMTWQLIHSQALDIYFVLTPYLQCTRNTSTIVFTIHVQLYLQYTYNCTYSFWIVDKVAASYWNQVPGSSPLGAWWPLLYG